MRKLTGAFILLAMVAYSSAPAALAFNQRITVYASVPQMRAIYTDQTGRLIRVAGNTAKNIEPDVYDQNYHLIAMTDPLRQQYLRFLKSHDWRLEPGKVYKINPVTVNLDNDNRSISVAPGRQLSLAI